MAKVRTDFVTNSSSSSFILAFDNESQIEEIRNELPSYWKEGIIDMIIADIKDGIITKEKAIDEFKENIDTYDLRFKEKRVWDYLWEDQDDPTTEVGAFIQNYKDKKAEKFIQEIEQYKLLSSISYSDNDGSLHRELEHDIIPYLKNTIITFDYH